MATTLSIARRFLDNGGRLMIEPDGTTTFAIDAAKLFSLDLTDQRRLRSLRIGRAMRAAAQKRAADLATLIRQHGTTGSSGWIVWEGC